MGTGDGYQSMDVVLVPGSPRGSFCLRNAARSDAVGDGGESNASKSA